MRPIIFCDRCRGLEVGWNRKYLTHSLVCHGGFPKPFQIFVYTITAALIISIFPTTTEMVYSNQAASDKTPAETEDLGPQSLDGIVPLELGGMPISDPAVYSIEGLLERNSRVSAVARARIARAVVASSRKYDVDPYLVTSILLVESSGNPFAISGRDAVGIMQIHVPTWGSLVDMEKINLFRVEDNIDLGARILKDYTRRYGLWDGVMRYLGAGGPSDEAMEYVSRVQDIFTDRNAD
jgi:hypothetical protein